MALLTSALYWIATGLLVPVVVLLLFYFGLALATVGRLYGQYVARSRRQSVLRPALDAATAATVVERLEPALNYRGPLPEALRTLIRHRASRPHREHTLSQFELHSEQRLATARQMARLGPMLGLMGTLIPMGPALVGLAAGDLQALASNLIVAFSTTVVGLTAGGIGFVAAQSQERWFTEDLNTLEFVDALLDGASPAEERAA
jgi:biopolymer transport protein ExbB/TolQ